MSPGWLIYQLAGEYYSFQGGELSNAMKQDSPSGKKIRVSIAKLFISPFSIT